MPVKVTRNSNTPVSISDIAPHVPGRRLAHVWAKRTGVPELIWPRFGRLFGIDDDQVLFNIPYTSPASATAVADIGDTVQVINGLMQHDGVMYGVRSDLLSNPLYTDEWFLIGQNGDVRKIGNFPANWHTRGLAYDVARNRVYFLRGGNTNARVMRYEGLTQANITGVFEETTDSERTIMPGTLATWATLTGYGASTSCAFWDDYLYVGGAFDQLLRLDVTQDSPTVEVVGTFPASLQAARGMTIVHGRIVVTDDSDRLWWCWPDSPDALQQIAGQIPSVTGELECLVYMPRELVGTALPPAPGQFPADVAAVWPQAAANVDSAYSVTLQASGQDRLRISTGIGTQHEAYNDPDVLAPILDRIREQDQPGRIILNQPAREIDFSAYSANPGYIYWVSDTAGSVEYGCFSMRREAAGGLADADGGGFWRLNTSHSWPISAIEHAYIITDDWRDGVPDDADAAEVRSNMNARFDAWLEDGVNLLIAFGRDADWDPLALPEPPQDSTVTWTPAARSVDAGYGVQYSAIAATALGTLDVTPGVMRCGLRGPLETATGTSIATGLANNASAILVSNIDTDADFITALGMSTVTHDGNVYAYQGRGGSGNNWHLWVNTGIAEGVAAAQARFGAGDTFLLTLPGFTP